MPGTDRRLEKGSLSLSAEVTVCLFNPSSQIIGIKLLLDSVALLGNAGQSWSSCITRVCTATDCQQSAGCLPAASACCCPLGMPSAAPESRVLAVSS